MSLVERAGLALLSRLDPEDAHGLAIAALRRGLRLAPRVPPLHRLTTSFAGLTLPNPIGLAAGFDKQAEAVDTLLGAGFGFVEVGAVTPKPQPGNPRPRLFRLVKSRAAINRFGFNSDGMEAVAERLAKRGPGIVGLNLGANKDSADKAADFAAVLARCGPYVDFATVNVSSPNTERLRDLQGPDALRRVLDRVQEANQALAIPRPLLVKIAPDLTKNDLAAIARAAEGAHLSGIVATNTTTARAGLTGPHAAEAGGLSGAPLFQASTAILGTLAHLTDLPLMGVGGIGSGADAYAKIRAGAGAVQLYTALAFRGLSLLPQIACALDAALAADGYAAVADAVGAAARSKAG